MGLRSHVHIPPPINTCCLCYYVLFLFSYFSLIQLRQQDRVVQEWEWRHLDSSPSSPLDMPWSFRLSTTFPTSSVSHSQQEAASAWPNSNDFRRGCIYHGIWIFLRQIVSIKVSVCVCLFNLCLFFFSGILSRTFFGISPYSSSVWWSWCNVKAGEGLRNYLVQVHLFPNETRESWMTWSK